MPFRSRIVAILLLAIGMSSPVLAAAPRTGSGAGVVPPENTPWALLALPQGAAPVQIRADLHLLDIQKINVEDETFEFSAVLTLTWQDDRQRFDPALNGVSEMVFNGAYQFDELAPSWFPQAVLTNASEIQQQQGVLLRVSADGTCTLVQTINATARSALNLRKYPFDRQRLELVIEILGFDDSEVAITVGDVTVDRSAIQIPQWDFDGLTASTRVLSAPYAGTRGSTAALVAHMDVERQSFFVMRLVVLPLLVIMMLSWAVFWMDRASLGDRMAVSFVGILTAVAYQTTVSSIMPQISYMTLIHGFLYFSFLLMCATVVVNLVVGNHDRRGQTLRGDVIDRRCRWAFPAVFIALMFVLGAAAFGQY